MTEEQTTTHVDIATTLPENYRAMVTLSTAAERAAADAGLDPLTVELIKIRASQLNGCAFCLRMHTRDALRLGETTDRLAVVAAWWESQYFTEVERAALTLTEQLTLLGDAPAHGTPAVEDVLHGAQFAAATWLVVVINAWNRVAIGSHSPVAP